MTPPRSRRSKSSHRPPQQRRSSSPSRSPRSPHLFPVETARSPQNTPKQPVARAKQKRSPRRPAAQQKTNLITRSDPHSQEQRQSSTGRVVNLNVAGQRRNRSEQTLQSRVERYQSEQNNRFFDFGLIVFRLLICGVGLGAIAGTVLAAITPKSTEPPPPPLVEPVEESEPVLDQLPALKEKLDTLVAQFPELEPGAFFVDLDNDAYVDLSGEASFAAASTIKIPVLVAFFQDVEAQKIRLDEMLTMKPELIANESGDMQYQEPGSQFSALETATKMIVISDNTATNMLIERLGGAEALNQRFQEWGLPETAIRNPLPDLEGTNTTSPKDLAHLLSLVERGELVSGRSRDRLLHIMRGTVTRTLLPQGLEDEALIAHKTGDIGTVIGDAGIVDMPSGKRYVAAVLVNRPHNDPQARTLIQEMSKIVYQHFKWYQPRPFTEEAGSSELLENEQ